MGQPPAGPPPGSPPSAPKKSGPPVVVAVVAVGLAAVAIGYLAFSDSGSSEPAGSSVRVLLRPPADVAAPPADAERTSSGLVTKVVRPGTGTRHPTAVSRVEVHYTGWTTDGEMFDSSETRGEPIQFPLTNVVAGWREGVQLMVEGERRRMWIPEALAYQGRDGFPAGTLVFEVELLRIVQ